MIPGEHQLTRGTDQGKGELGDCIWGKFEVVPPFCLHGLYAKGSKEELHTNKSVQVQKGGKKGKTRRCLFCDEKSPRSDVIKCCNCHRKYAHEECIVVYQDEYFTKGEEYVCEDCTLGEQEEVDDGAEIVTQYFATIRQTQKKLEQRVQEEDRARKKGAGEGKIMSSEIGARSDMNVVFAALVRSRDDHFAKVTRELEARGAFTSKNLAKAEQNILDEYAKLDEGKPSKRRKRMIVFSDDESQL